MPVVFGIDISDEGTSVASDKNDEAVKFPTAVVKERDSDRWMIGEQAYEMMLDNRALNHDN